MAIRKKRAGGSRRRAEPAPLSHPPSERLAAAFARVLEIAQKLPGVEESRSYGTPAIKVKGKLLARLRSEDEGGLAIRCDFVDRQMLMQADPDAFYLTPHYENYPMVLIDLTKVRWDAMPQIIEQAWRMVASVRLVQEWERSRAT